MNKIEKILISKRKIIQKILLLLSLLSLLFLLSPDAIKQTGEMAMKLLWLILWLPILAKVFSSKIASKLMLFRKELGILMGSLALVHSAQYFFDPEAHMIWESLFWLQDGLLSYLGFGMIATIITAILTITSNSWSMKKLGKYWKYLHRTVYILIIFVLLHVAFIDVLRSEGDILIAIMALIPFILYFSFKILEWRGVRLRK